VASSLLPSPRATHYPHARPSLFLTVVLLLLLLLFLTGSTLAERFKVVSISDGDTFTGLDSQNRQVKIRLHGIAAPEKAHAFGNVSRKALGDLIEGKTVEVQQVDKDRYGRVVGVSRGF
jgi:micrococcal nuclease